MEQTMRKHFFLSERTMKTNDFSKIIYDLQIMTLARCLYSKGAYLPQQRMKNRIMGSDLVR